MTLHIIRSLSSGKKHYTVQEKAFVEGIAIIPLVITAKAFCKNRRCRICVPAEERFAARDLWLVSVDLSIRSAFV